MRYIIPFFIFASLLRAQPTTETLFEIEMPPTVFSPDIRELPSIKIDDRSSVAPNVAITDREVMGAVTHNDVGKLDEVLRSNNRGLQMQAAQALGAVTEHKADARSVLESFLSRSQTSNRTEFGDQLFARLAIESVASTSLARLQSSWWPWCAAALIVAVVSAWFVHRRSKTIQASS